MRYHVKERFLTIKDDFVVRNDKNEIVFDVKGSFLRVGDYLHIYDRNTGEEVFSIKEKVFTYEKQYMFYQNGSEIATIRHKKEPDFANNFFEVDCASGIVLQLHGNFKEWGLLAGLGGGGGENLVAIGGGEREMIAAKDSQSFDHGGGIVIDKDIRAQAGGFD